MKEKYLFYFLGFLAFLTFIGGIGLAYDMGFATGGNSVCGDLSFGVTIEGDYICYNESYNVPINPSLEYLEGDYYE